MKLSLGALVFCVVALFLSVNPVANAGTGNRIELPAPVPFNEVEVST